jgi:hypothetical protein
MAIAKRCMECAAQALKERGHLWLHVQVLADAVAEAVVTAAKGYVESVTLRLTEKVRNALHAVHDQLSIGAAKSYLVNKRGDACQYQARHLGYCQ